MEVENPACYCLECNWQGHDDDLFDDIVLDRSVCPQCHSDQIVYTE